MKENFFTVVTNQTKGYVSIFQLKIKIIGFSNKRSGLFARLGESVYRTRGEREDVSPGADTLKIIHDIEHAEREIVEAEKEINELRQSLSMEWNNAYGSPNHAAPQERSAQENAPPSKNDVIMLTPDPTPSPDSATSQGEKSSTNTPSDSNRA